MSANNVNDGASGSRDHEGVATLEEDVVNGSPKVVEEDGQSVDQAAKKMQDLEAAASRR